MKTLCLLILFLSFTPETFACRDSLSETQTFFKELPQSLASKENVAKIKVLSTEINEEHVRITTAQVVSAIKSMKKGASIRIVSDTISCNRDPDIRKNQEYDIAGTLAPDGTFSGVWKRQDLTKQK